MSAEKNCYIYAHYTFGIGHIQRASLLAKELSKSKNFKVFLFFSGTDFKRRFNGNYQVIRLPAEIKPGRSSKVTLSSDKNIKKSEIADIRVKRLTREFKKNTPDMFITEFFPFAYIRLNKTLMPVLKYLKKNHPACNIVCSAREFPISDRESIHNYDKNKLRQIIKEYYSLILIHSPKKLSMFGSKNKILGDLKGLPIKFTGYIVENTLKNNHNTKKNMSGKKILISVGGGKDGVFVIKKTLKALSTSPLKKKFIIDIITGPFSTFSLPKNKTYNGFKRLRLRRYIHNLHSHMPKYDLIISMAGYNTVAEIMSLDIPAIVFPRPKSYEQIRRAKKLSSVKKNVDITNENIKIPVLKNKIEGYLSKKEKQRAPKGYLSGLNDSFNEISKLIKRKRENDTISSKLIEMYFKSIEQAIENTNQTLIEHLSKIKNKKGKFIVVGWGKSADNFINTIINRIPTKKLSGCIYLSLRPTLRKAKIKRLKATHPLISKKNLEGSSEIIKLLRKSKENDTVIIVSSGGGSAMFELLKPQLSLHKVRKVTSLLMRSNADCRIINYVRRCFSQIKGGKLLRFIKAKKIITFIISDDVLTKGKKSCAMHVASGPTKKVIMTKKDRKKMFKALENLNITSIIPKEYFITSKKERDLIPRKEVEHVVLCDNKVLLKIIEKKIRELGITTKIRKEPYYGESPQMAKILFQEFKSYLNENPNKPFAYICGGESTVNLKGKGKGGRIQELTGHLIKPISTIEGLHAFGFCSDGQDYLKGITGTYINNKSYSKVKESLKIYLKNNDSYHLHKKLSSLIKTPNKNINLGDVVILFKE